MKINYLNIVTLLAVIALPSFTAASEDYVPVALGDMQMVEAYTTENVERAQELAEQGQGNDTANDTVKELLTIIGGAIAVGALMYFGYSDNSVGESSNDDDSDIRSDWLDPLDRQIRRNDERDLEQRQEYARSVGGLVP